MNLLFNLLATEAESSSSTQGGLLGGSWIWIILIVFFAGSMIMSSRQRKKQQAETEKKMNSIKVGDIVKTIGLIYGEIVEVDTEMETFVIKTGTDENPSYIKVDKMAIYQVIPPIENNAESVENADAEVEAEVVEENILPDEADGNKEE